MSHAAVKQRRGCFKGDRSSGYYNYDTLQTNDKRS